MADDPREIAPPPSSAPIYDPDLLAAIRSARADLYAAQAERRRGYLSTGKFAPPKERDLSPVQAARAELNAARALARDTASQPKGDDRADV